MKIGTVLRDLHKDENDLAHDLLRISERHKADHELYHLARDLAKWSQRHVTEIARIAPQYGETLDPDPKDELALMEKVREKGSELTGRSSDAELLMLRDLREIFLKASQVSLDWLMIAQAAQAIQHDDLLALAKRCQPEAERQSTWAKAKIKESSTQALVV